MNDMDKESWENLCRRCGRCCYEKLDYDGEIHYTDTPCRCLDLQTRLCTVYPDRHTARPGCTPITPEIASRGILPADCPYVEGIADYRSPRLWDDESPEES